MKFVNNARTGVRICAVILLIAVVLLVIINIIPISNENTLGSVNQLMQYTARTNNTEMPIWKTVGYIIASILFVVDLIIYFVMCRCHNCGKLISAMNIFMMYCPYCSKSLDI